MSTATKTIESRSEIEGAKRLLKVAQAWHKSAVDMLHVIQTKTDGACVAAVAKSHVLKSEKEVKGAVAYLKEIEQRWEVIDVDDDVEPSKKVAKSVRNAGCDETSSNADAIVISDSGDDAESHGSPANVSVSRESPVNSPITDSQALTDDGNATLSSTTPGSNIQTPTLSNANNSWLDIEKSPGGRIRKSWQCDFCEVAKFKDWNEAVEHEKTCDKNPARVVQTSQASNGPVEGVTTPDSTKRNRDRGTDTLKVKSEVIELDDLDSTDDIEYQYQVTLEGCGVSDINGVFTMVGFHDGVPKYKKYGKTAYTILHGLTKSHGEGDVKKWFIVGPKVSGLNSDICYYTAREGVSKSNAPPQKWRVANGDMTVKAKGVSPKEYRGRGLHPAPKSPTGNGQNFFDSNNKVIDELLVEHTTNQKVSGEYKRQGYVDGVSTFFKTVDGLPTAKMYRGRWFNSSVWEWQQGWSIALFKRDKWVVKYRTLRSNDSCIPIGAMGEWIRISGTHMDIDRNLRVELKDSEVCNKRIRLI